MANSRDEPHGRTALVLFGSETGNAQDVAEELGRICERLRFETQVAEMNEIDIVCDMPDHLWRSSHANQTMPNRDNSFAMISPSLPFPRLDRAIYPQTLRRSGRPCEAFDSLPVVCGPSSSHRSVWATHHTQSMISPSLFFITTHKP